jgi:uncharacterized protein (TIGR03086 family)
LVTPELAHASTPCRDWDLTALMLHMDDSLRALQEAADLGLVTMTTAEPDDPEHLVAGLRTRAGALLGAWTANQGAELVSVAGCPLTAKVLVLTGALEVAVHGWDVAQTCGNELPIPKAVAADLVTLVPSLVDRSGRGSRFAPAVPVPPWASPGDLLVAALGRRPWRPARPGLSEDLGNAS